MTTEELLTLYRTALVDKICGEMYENRQPYNKGAVADREAVPISKKFTPKEAGLIVADCNERYGQTRGEETVYHYEFYYRWDGHLFIISEYVSGKKGEKMGFKSDGIQLINESTIQEGKVKRMQEEQLKIDGEIDRLEKVKKAIKGGWLDVSLAKRAIRESHDLDSILSAARSLVTAAEKLEIVFKKLEETK